MPAGTPTALALIMITLTFTLVALLPALVTVLSVLITWAVVTLGSTPDPQDEPAVGDWTELQAELAEPKAKRQTYSISDRPMFTVSRFDVVLGRCRVVAPPELVHVWAEVRDLRLGA